MLNRILCALLGHKTIVREYSRKFEVAPDPIFGGTCPVFFYKIVRLPFCTRCGVKAHADGERIVQGE